MLQHVFRLRGRFVARVDFYWPQYGVVVELDGVAKYADPRTGPRESRRGNALAELGLIVLHFGWFDVVHAPEATVALVRRAMTRFAA